MEIRAQAKINLFLNVGPRREDGYHEIISLMSKVSLEDTLLVEPAEDISIKCSENIPPEDNLAYRAAIILKDRTGTERGCRIKLNKNIPLGGGLGGGSSDAASVLLALNRLWELDLSREELSETGSLLGSDVNFFLYPGPCIVRGRGEVIEPLEEEAEKKHNIIIIDPGVNISTERIYSSYPGGSLTPSNELDKIIKSYTKGDWSMVLRNDLEETVYSQYPVLKDLRNRLLNWGPIPLLSGSGSCLFALAGEDHLAESAVRVIENSFGFRSWIVNEV